MKLLLTEQICVMKKIGTSRRTIDIGVLKKHIEPITHECATYTLNTLSLKFLKPFLMWTTIECLATTGVKMQLKQLR